MISPAKGNAVGIFLLDQVFTTNGCSDISSHLEHSHTICIQEDISANEPFPTVRKSTILTDIFPPIAINSISSFIVHIWQPPKL